MSDLKDLADELAPEMTAAEAADQLLHLCPELELPYTAKAIRMAINALRREGELLREEEKLLPELWPKPAMTREEAILLVPVEILRNYWLANGPSQRAIVRDTYREWLKSQEADQPPGA